MMEQKYAQPPLSIADDELLDKDEVIVIVDDYADIVILLQDFLQQQGFASITAATAEELRRYLRTGKVALVLLDIGLPDANGTELIPELKQDDPDLAVIMLTAVTDLQTALACLRFGADDYLTKPVHFTDLLTTLRKVLEKRRLKINNRHYQRQIEEARFRIQFNHELAMKMNTAYLSTIELDEILQAILVGITAEEGLQYNRAFLALFDASGEILEGRLAIGPGKREDGGRIWQDIRNRELRLHDLLENIHSKGLETDTEVNRIVRALNVHVLDADHILLRAVRERRSIHVLNGQCNYPVPVELLGLLGEDTFVIVPLYSPSRSLGVIIADHFVTRSAITTEQISALESFAGQASLAIEHCHLYMAMQRKIQELEALTRELDKNKDLLIEAERYSTVGHMAAQLAHSIRNPITAIGGTARLLARKTEDRDTLQFFNLMISESEKIEKTLEDLFTFVEQVKPVLEKTHLLPLVHRSLLLHFNTLHEQEIEQEVLLPEEDPLINADPRLIQQALVHLIRNSVEAMPRGGLLTVAVRLEEGRVTIVISDSGEGLGSIHPARATDPFFTTKMIGTGMGLTLVKRIVEDHHGTLRLESRENGHGTIATVVFPRVV
ncbi:response regulator [Desulfobulbus alkaliphilus]|uniref:response regulator n=1 Tax=Desulfobulbus alkaliphilus TaxID=869814 RepID=UPI001965CF25|nr:response regulator [Desulfobulbus alkaliphilus]MBM9537839.1 response regulator [Desulfobulbus alkaliphilus]